MFEAVLGYYFLLVLSVCVEGEFVEGLIIVYVVIIVLEKREKDLGRLWAGLVSGVWVLVLFVALFGVVLNVPVVWGSGTIYIRADGSIDPPTAPIFTLDNSTYTFTDSINDSIVVERSNITIDGNGYTLQGTGAYSSKGIELSSVNNVTIRNTNIKGFYEGILLRESSNNNTLVGNNVTDNYNGITLELLCHNNTLLNNNVSSSIHHGILGGGYDNKFFGNVISYNWEGMFLSSSNNVIVDNIIAANNYRGVFLGFNHNSTIFHNDFIDDSVDLYESVNNVWDDGYPSGGNYWSYYTGVDELSGPNQDQPGSDGIGDTPHPIGDRYPLMRPHALNFTYIRSDGSVDPSTAPIQHVGDLYTFTDDIYGSIVIERDNLVVDGAGYKVQGLFKTATGIELSERSNATLGNVTVESFKEGVNLINSSHCTLTESSIINNHYGVIVETLGEVIIERNEISGNSETGIMIVGVSNVLIKENLVQGSKNGIATDDSSTTYSGIVIVGNRILENSGYGVHIHSKGHLYNVTLSSNNVSANGENGIDLSTEGTGYVELHDITFSSNNVSSNGESGVILSLGSYISGYTDLYNVTFCSNVISANGGSGITLQSVGFGDGAWPMGQGHSYIRNVVFSSNIVSENGARGIYLTSYGRGYYDYGYSYIYDITFSSNTLLGNDGGGIILDSKSVNDGGHGGMNCANLYNIMFSSNRILASDKNGIYLYSQGDVCSYLYNVTLSSNIVSANSENGVLAEARDHLAEFDLAMSNNTVSSNHQKGIWIEGGINANLTHNSICYNTHGVFCSTSTNNSAKYNDIYRNSYGMNVTTGAAVNATYDYWGDASGPYHESLNVNGSGNSVNGNGVDLEFIPFLANSVGQINDCPVATLIADQTNVEINQTVTFNASASTDDEQIEYYFFNYGDETNSGWTTSPIVIHKYAFQGAYNVTLVVMDNMGVTSVANSFVYVEDHTPPTTVHDYNGLWHTADFTISLNATDDLSGVAETYYKINDNPLTKTVSAEGQPIITTEGANNTLEYWSVDNADNEELPHKILTGLKLDKTASTIETPSRTPDGDVLPDQSVKVSVNVTDATSQVKNVTLYYTINDGETWTDLPMNHTASNLYEATIPPQQAGTTVRFKIVPYDHAGNTATLDGTEPYCVYQVIPEFPSSLILPIFMIITLLAAIAYKRKHPPL